MTATNSLESRLNSLILAENKVGENNLDEGNKWGIQLKELYRYGLNFYKDKSGKAVHLSYEDNLKLVAFTQQATHGPLDLSEVPPLGVLDVIGKDRRLAWQHLGSISKGQAMEGYIDLLDRLCPSFKPYVEAIKKDKEEKLRLAKEEELRQIELKEKERVLREMEKKINEEKNREEIQRRQLQDALNQQTYLQFKTYAEKQFPGNPEQQGLLIKQLQNEHYHQYMQQLQAQVMTGELDKRNIESNDNNCDDNNGLCNINNCNNDKETKQCEVKEQCESDNESEEYSCISPANMWTRTDIKLFKQEVSAGKGDGVIRVGHGDTVTVRVPTHEGGSCLFWEFATDSYDIGFGVYFEWGKPPTTEVTVHISESDDDEDVLEEDDEITSVDDLESGPLQTMISSLSKNRPPLSIIIPVYRRDCQNEVYAGSHNYPGEGVYLLKFDNSYSLWRSKTLYYRVFYTR